MATQPPKSPETLRWAGNGHVRAFLLQLSCLVAVLLAVWGFFLIWALRLADRGAGCILGC